MAAAFRLTSIDMYIRSYPPTVLYRVAKYVFITPRFISSVCAPLSQSTAITTLNLAVRDDTYDDVRMTYFCFSFYYNVGYFCFVFWFCVGPIDLHDTVHIRFDLPHVVNTRLERLSYFGGGGRRVLNEFQYDELQLTDLVRVSLSTVSNILFLLLVDLYVYFCNSVA